MKIIAVIGCGRIANKQHLPALSKIDEVRIKYACDLIPEKTEKAKESFPKIENVITDYHVALADPEVDAVYVLTPNFAHYTITMDALKTSAATTLFVSFFLFGSELYSILLNLLGMVPGVIVAIFMPAILKRFDKFKMLFWCNVINVILGFVIYFVGFENQTLFLTLTCIRALPLCLVGVLAFMFTPDCAEYGQYKSGISAKGITFAIQTFSVKITGAVSSALALFLLGLFAFPKIETDSFAELAAMNIQLSDRATNGLWIVYALVPVIGMVISTFFYLGYKLNDKDVQIMAKCNSGEITREEAEKLLSRKY